MNRVLQDARSVAAWTEEQRGVFAKSDLQTILGEKHPAAFVRRVGALVEQHALRRFVRGWYVTERFDLPTLSQRLAPESYVSFGNVLAEQLVIGTRPARQVTAVKVGRTRTYKGLGVRIVHVGVTRPLFFGFQARDGVCYAVQEKAFLDSLYFHLRGRRYGFDVYGDIHHERLDRERIAEYLAHYRNPRFVAFVRNVIERAAA
jgi:hypothetical protein